MGFSCGTTTSRRRSPAHCGVSTLTATRMPAFSAHATDKLLHRRCQSHLSIARVWDPGMKQDEQAESYGYRGNRDQEPRKRPHRVSLARGGWVELGRLWRAP